MLGLDLDDDVRIDDGATLAVESPRDLSAAYERDAEALGDDPRAAPLWLAAGRVYESEPVDLVRAAACYDKAVTNDPSHVPALIAARRTHIVLGNWERVAELLEKESQQEKRPDVLAAIHTERARVLEKLGRADDAKAAFAAARDANPGALAEERLLYQKLRERNELLPAYEVLDGFASAVEDPAVRADLHRELADLSGPKLGDADIALAHHEAVLERDPTDAIAFSAVSRALRTKSRFADLARLWTRRAEKTDDADTAATAHYRAARIFSDDLGDEPQAVTELQRAVERSPGHPLASAELVRLYEVGGRWAELVALLEKEVELTAAAEERAQRLFRIGQIHEEELTEEPKAIARYQEVVSLRPNFLPALQALGKLYSRTGRWNELAAMYEAEILATPEPALKVPKLFKLAEIVDVHIKDDQRAITLYQQILDLEPGYVPAANALGRLLSKAGRYEDLIALYEGEARAATELEQKISMLEKVARIAEDHLKDVDRSAKAYRAILELDQNHLRSVRALGVLFSRAERWRDLIEINELESSLISDAKQTIDLKHKNGEIWEERIGDKEKAIEAYKHVLGLAPNYLPSLRSLGRLYWQKGRWQDLAAMYRQEIEVTSVPEQAAALHFKIGEVLLEKIVDEEAAAAELERVLEIVPTHRQALASLSAIMRNRGNWSKLISVIEREAQATTDPRQRAARYFEAGELCETRLSDGEAAIGCYEKSLEAVPGFAPALEALLTVLLERGELERMAMKLASTLDSARDPAARARASRRLGDMRMRNFEDPEGAIRAFETVLAQDPADVHCWLQLERLYGERKDERALVRVLEKLAELSTDKKLALAYHLQVAALKERLEIANESSYRAVLAIDPENAHALRALDTTLHRAHDTKGLDALYQQLEAKATQTMARSLLVERAEMVLDAGGDPSLLVERLEALVADEPQNLHALRVLRRVYDKSGNWDGFLRLSEAEGRQTVDVARAAKLLTDVGLVQWKKTGDKKAAKATLRAALERDPTSRTAFDALTDLLSASEDWADLAALLRTRKSVQYLIEAGSIFLAKVDEREKARECFEEALEKDPERVEAHMALGELCATGEDPIRAVDHYARALKSHASNEQTALVHAKLAELYCLRLADMARGQQHLRAAMAANPLDLVTLDTTLAVLRKMGDVPAAKAVLSRMIELTEDPVEKAKRCVALGELLSAAGDEAGAQTAFDRAAKVNPDVALPEERAAGTLERVGNWKKLLESLQDSLKKTGHGPARAPLHARVASIYAEQLKDFTLAASEMKLAVQSDPEDGALVERLGLYLAANPATLSDAATQFRVLLEADATRAQTLRALCRVYAQLHANDKAYCFAEALVFLRAADAEEQSYYQKGKEQASFQINGALAPEDVRKALLDPTEGGAVGELFEALASELPDMYPPKTAAGDIPKADRLNQKSTDSLRVSADAVAKALGVAEYLLLVTDAEDVVADAGDPPGLYVARDFLRRVQPAEQRLQLGAGLLGLRQAHHLVRRMPPTELAIFVEAVVLAVHSDYEPVARSADRVEELARSLRSAFSRKAKKALEAPAKRFAADQRSFDPRAYAHAATMSELRAGLLCAGNLETATRALAKRQGMSLPAAFQNHAEAVEALSRLEGFIPLLHFFLSEDHFALRKKLHIGL